MAKKLTDEDREEIIALVEGTDRTYEEIGEKFDVTAATVSNVYNGHKDEVLEQEEVDALFKSAGTKPTPDEVYDKIKDIPGVGKGRAKAIKQVLDARPAVLNDPNIFYQVLNETLDIDTAWLEQILYVVYPELDPAAQQQQQQQRQPFFQQGQFGGGGGFGQAPNFQLPQQQAQPQLPAGLQQAQGGMDPQIAAILQQMQNQQQLLQEQLSEANGQSESDRERQLLERIDRLERKLDGDKGERSLIDEIKELNEVKDVLEGFSGADDDEMEQVAAQMRAGFRELAQHLDESGGDRRDPQLEGLDPNMQALYLLSQTTNIDDESLSNILGEITSVETDPEVAAKKYEAEAKKADIERERERWDALTKTAENLVGSFGALVEGATGGPEPSPSEPQRDERDYTPQVRQQVERVDVTEQDVIREVERAIKARPELLEAYISGDEVELGAVIEDAMDELPDGVEESVVIKAAEDLLESVVEQHDDMVDDPVEEAAEEPPVEKPPEAEPTPDATETVEPVEEYPPVTELSGIGDTVAAKLHELGIDTPDDLAQALDRQDEDVISAIPAMWREEVADQLGVEGFTTQAKA